MRYYEAVVIRSSPAQPDNCNSRRQRTRPYKCANMVIGFIKRSERASAASRQPQAVPAQQESFSARLPETRSSDAHRAHLAGRSSKELRRPANSVPANTDSAAQTTSWALNIRKTSGKLLAALRSQQRQQDMSSATTPAATANTEPQSSAVPGPSCPATDSEPLTNFPQELLVPTPIEPSSVVQRSNPTAVTKSSWARMPGKSSRKLLPVVLEADSAPTSPAAPENNTPSTPMESSSTTKAACSAGPQLSTTVSARGFWDKLVSRSSRKLLSDTAGEDAKAPHHTKLQTNKVSGSGTSVKHLIRAMTGRSLQAGTAKPHSSQWLDLGNSTNSSRAKLAGLSSKKLLSATETGSACSSNTAAAVVSGRSSRRLLGMTTSNRESNAAAAAAAAAAAVTVAAAATAATTFSSQSSLAERRNLLANSASCRLLAAGRQVQSCRLLAADRLSAAASGASGATHDPGQQATTTRNSRAVLASKSTRKLLGAAAHFQPQAVGGVPLIAADEATFIGDAVVHIQSTDVSSKAACLGKAASTTARPDASEESAEAPASASNTSGADFSTLALLISHAADKAVLLQVASELGSLAASSASCKLMVGQCSETIQGIAHLLNTADEDLQEAATTLIGNLSSGEPRNQAKLASNTALVDGVIDMLGSSVEALKMPGGPATSAAVQAARAAVALWALAADNSATQARICARHPGEGRDVARCLYDMMLYPATGAYAAGLTWILVASNSENQAMFADVESVRRLLMLMAVGSEMEGEYAAGVLTCLLGGSEEAKRSASVMALGNWVQMLLRDGAGSDGARASMQEIVEMLGV